MRTIVLPESSDPMDLSDLAVLLAGAYRANPDNAGLARELRMTLLALAAPEGRAGDGGLERFLESVSNPAFSGPGD